MPHLMWTDVAKVVPQLGYDIEGREPSTGAISVVINASTDKSVTKFEYETMKVLFGVGVQYFLVGDDWEMTITPNLPKVETGFRF